MKKLSAFRMILVVFLSACAPIIPGSGVSTPIEITAEVSTVIAETAGPPPTEGPRPRLNRRPLFQRFHLPHFLQLN